MSCHDLKDAHTQPFLLGTDIQVQHQQTVRLAASAFPLIRPSAFIPFDQASVRRAPRGGSAEAIGHGFGVVGLGARGAGWAAARLSRRLGSARLAHTKSTHRS